MPPAALPYSVLKTPTKRVAIFNSALNTNVSYASTLAISCKAGQ